MKKRILILFIRYVFLLIFFNINSSCTQKTVSFCPQNLENEFTASESPFSLSSPTVTFHKDILYGSDERNVFDIFMPNQTAPSSVLIMIHGGGFVTGNKENYYDSYRHRSFINRLLENNIAIISINYRFIDLRNKQGILNSLTDAKSALQYIRHYADMLHVNKSKIMLLGNSAGAATALWIGLNDDMADVHHTNVILRESTRVEGIIAIATQANYDVKDWHNTVFSTYKDKGFGEDEIKKLLNEYRVFQYYGTYDRTQFSSEETKRFIEKTNMLKMLSADDPTIYVTTDKFPNDIPITMSEVFHHPLHVKAIQQQAEKVGAKGIFYCPQIDLDTRKGETYEDFIIRKIGHKKISENL